MTRETEQIEQDIRNLQNRRTEAPVTPSGNVRGYTVAVTILTDLFGCIFIGFVLGLCGEDEEEGCESREGMFHVLRIGGGWGCDGVAA